MPDHVVELGPDRIPVRMADPGLRYNGTTLSWWSGYYGETVNADGDA